MNLLPTLIPAFLFQGDGPIDHTILAVVAGVGVGACLIAAQVHARPRLNEAEDAIEILAAEGGLGPPGSEEGKGG